MTMPPRPMRHFATALAAVVLLASAVHAFASAASSSPQGLADRATAQLVRGFGDYVARQMHYPAKDGSEERAKDIANAAATLNAIVTELGSGPPPRSVGGKIQGIYYAVGGGTEAYRQALTPRWQHPFVYWSRFSNFGATLIRVTVGKVREDSPFEILLVEIGLPERTEDATARVASLMEKAFIRQHGAVTPGMRRKLGEFLSKAKNPEATEVPEAGL